MRSEPCPRSYLFVPGNRPERFDKALASGADAVIVDLEDAVPPDQKDAARALVGAWLSAARPVVVRINAADTAWFSADVALCRQAGVAAVMLAKSERVEDLAEIGNGLPLIPLIESAPGFDNLRAIAAAQNVQRLAFGAIDFQLDLNMRANFEELLFFRSQFVLGSKLANLAAPIDSPSTAIDDLAEVEAEAQRARRLGFGAKLCIHPKQVGAVNASFSPSAAELAWAQRVIAIAATSQGAAVALDGKMVDKPVMLRAQAILREQRLPSAD
ncbi:MAG: CoA ester lyase [Rhizobacter sp.]|nr:CoA ester lyase [Rhizobacter sp.]